MVSFKMSELRRCVLGTSITYCILLRRISMVSFAVSEPYVCTSAPFNFATVKTVRTYCSCRYAIALLALPFPRRRKQYVDTTLEREARNVRSGKDATYYVANTAVGTLVLY